ncbi:MAG TPA: diiron oxygenase [Planktothrix sp.]
MSEWATTVEKLCRASEREYYNPSHFEWPQTVEKDAWHMSPELISIYGTAEWKQLTEQRRRLLSFYEAINFFSLNIHGEKSLVEGLAHRLYAKGNQDVSPYLHHFLDEENKHMMYFGGFCMRYAGKIYPDRKMAFPRDYAPGEEDFLFFAKVMIFEEIVDAYNVKMGLDERLHTVAKQINLLHHKDEARHLVFGRQIVKELFRRHSPQWPEESLNSVREQIVSYLRTTWSEYYNPSVYKDAQLAQPYELQKTAMANDTAAQHRKTVSQACLRFLLQHEILQEEPEL